MGNTFLDASEGASTFSFAVRFFTSKTQILKTVLFLSPTFCCEVVGEQNLKPQILQWVSAYQNGAPLFSLPLNLSNLSPFTLKGLEAIAKIPLGKTASYQEIAQEIGCPKGARAIGNVCNKNPFPLIIPCHRVIGSGQKIGGFAYELTVKKQLLHFESHQLNNLR